MVRRIGFGEGSDDRTEPVRRRAGSTTPEQPQEDAKARRRAERRHAARSQQAAERASAPSPIGPWVEDSPAPSPSSSSQRRRSGPSFGKLIILGFLWVVLFNWALGAYGGPRNAIEMLRGLAEGYVDPIPALFPLIMPLAVGIFVTQLILGRRRKK